MVKIALAAALIAAALNGAKHTDVLERAGLFGSCSAVVAVASDANGWMACRSGRLSGYPDLSRNSCTLGGTREKIVFWRCPASLVASRTDAGGSETAQAR